MGTVYLLTLALHNLLRWIILILGGVTIVRAWVGWLGKAVSWVCFSAHRLISNCCWGCCFTLSSVL